MNSFKLKSMTAYGRGSALFPYGHFTVEIQSVNRRYLEINIGLPRLFMRFEGDIRKQASARIGRGMVNISISWSSDAKQPVSVKPNLSLARAIKEAWEEIAHDLDIKEKLSLNLIAQEKDLLLYQEELVDEEVYMQALNVALAQALQALSTMKSKEGDALILDLKARLCTLHAEMDSIESYSGEGAEKYRQKLTSRLQELFSGSSPEQEERILREVAIYAEKVDITEEIVRFKSHLGQFEHMIEKPLESEVETRGKTLDFLLQELNREINTIGSKASDLTIAQHVVAIKSELEKIREQIQNIE